MRLARAVEAIEQNGILLVYPLQNRPDPRSLWRALHPRSAMRWAWDETADPRVVELWHLREELARSRKVVYAKWLGGRATFFSREVFRALLSDLRRVGHLESGLSRDAQNILTQLQDESPQPTKMLRDRVELQGRAFESAWNRATRTLWSRLLLVGVGEEAEGGFPSLSVGATSVMFEDLWEASRSPRDGDETLLARVLDASPTVMRAYRRVRKELEAPVAVPRQDDLLRAPHLFVEEDPWAQPRASRGR